jgi:hypothetical protein
MNVFNAYADFYDSLYEDKSYRQGLYVPSGLTLTEEQIDIVCAAIEEIMSRGG